MHTVTSHVSRTACIQRRHGCHAHLFRGACCDRPPEGSKLFLRGHGLHWSPLYVLTPILTEAWQNTRTGSPSKCPFHSVSHEVEEVWKSIWPFPMPEHKFSVHVADDLLLPGIQDVPNVVSLLGRIEPHWTHLKRLNILYIGPVESH